MEVMLLKCMPINKFILYIYIYIITTERFKNALQKSGSSGGVPLCCDVSSAFLHQLEEEQITNNILSLLNMQYKYSFQNTAKYRH